jgi:DNA-binding MarR family transcriptional regulator
MSEKMQYTANLARRFHRISVARINERLARLGLSDTVHGVLRVLHAVPGISQRMLAQQCGLEAVTTGKIIDELVTQNWVRRDEDPTDRRLWRLKLTRQGNAVCETAISEVAIAEAELLSVLSEEEARKLERILLRIVELNRAYDKAGALRRRIFSK